MSAASASVDGDRIKVHNAFLYTDLLDASDWSAVLARERSRKQKEAIQAASREAAAEQAVRDELNRRAAVQALELAETRRRQRDAVKDAADVAAFTERNDAFLRRQLVLLDTMGPLEATEADHEYRARAQRFRNWEANVFLPTQREIDAKVVAKCEGGDCRPHLTSLKAASVSANPPHSLSSVLAAGSMSAAKVARLAKTSSSTSPHLSTLPPLNESHQEGSAALAPRTGGYDGGVGGINNSTALTWKERKDVMWRSFLSENNRMRKAGAAGVLLDVVDEIEYNPMAQCEAETIRYQRRTLPASDVDAQRAEAQRLVLAYTKLGLAYREEERRSRTGALAKKEASPSLSQQQQQLQMVSQHDDRASDGEVSEEGATKQRDGEWSRRAQVVTGPAYVVDLVPRTYVPFEFSVSGKPRQQGQEEERKAQAASSVAGSTVRGSLSHRCPPPPPHTTATTTVNDGKKSNGFRGGTTNRGTHRAGNGASRTKEAGDVAPPTFTEIAAAHPVDRDAVMPLPLPGCPPDSVRVTRRLLPWLVPPSPLAHGSTVTREAALPVKAWSAEEFRDTFYGRYVTANGEVKPSCERCIDDGAYLTASDVVFDHFNFPRDGAATHFGKRMDIWL